MPARNLVICADGTGNAFDTDQSNVARLVRVLVLNAPDRQRVFYHQGVGTKQSSTSAALAYARQAGHEALTIVEPRAPSRLLRPLARAAGLGFGWGLASNVESLYRALSNAYDPVDPQRLFLFGFSRGAFTVRALAGFIHRCGLLPPAHLDACVDAYDRYYEERHLEWMPEGQRAAFETEVERFRDAHDSRPCRIHFLGLWDTVKSYGFFYPRSLPHLRHNPSVQSVRHALALDERRAYFQPTTWGGVDHPTFSDTRADDFSDVQEVWFAGSHSDVAGSYPLSMSGLARMPFDWMVGEARTKDLLVNEDARREVLAELPDDMRIHESRHFGWCAAELLPRFELQNIPRPGERVLRWGATGTRHLHEMRRGGTLSVHASALDAYKRGRLVPPFPHGLGITTIDSIEQQRRSLSVHAERANQDSPLGTIPS
jgi:uncharacterized protein (DUF2235 family)